MKNQNQKCIISAIAAEMTTDCIAKEEEDSDEEEEEEEEDEKEKDAMEEGEKVAITLIVDDCCSLS